MSKIVRNLSTPESREFWRVAQEAASQVQSWPDWKRAGINVATQRSRRTGGADSSERNERQDRTEG